MFRDRPSMRPPTVQLRMLLPRDQFDALAREAARRGRGVSAASIAKSFIEAGLAQLEAERRPVPPAPFHDHLDCD